MISSRTNLRTLSIRLVCSEVGSNSITVKAPITRSKMPQPEAILGRIEHGERTRLAAEDHQQLLPSGDVLHVLLDAEQAGPGIADMLGHFASAANKRLSARIADQQCLAAGFCTLVYEIGRAT